MRQSLREWGLRHRPTTERLRVRAELLAAGGPDLWAEFMAELRTTHLGTPPPPRNGPSVSERLAAAYAATLESPGPASSRFPAGTM